MNRVCSLRAMIDLIWCVFLFVSFKVTTSRPDRWSLIRMLAEERLPVTSSHRLHRQASNPPKPSCRRPPRIRCTNRWRLLPAVLTSTRWTSAVTFIDLSHSAIFHSRILDQFINYTVHIPHLLRRHPLTTQPTANIRRYLLHEIYNIGWIY